MRKATIIVDLNFGDSSKGATVDYLCATEKVDAVFKYCGGHQSAHRVVLKDGREHVFSQFGSGTFRGVPTILTAPFIVSLPALKREAEVLQEKGVSSPHELVQIDTNCLLTTTYHRYLNRLRELSRDSRHGSCGVGIGETRSYWLKYGLDAITFRDTVCSDNLCHKLILLRERCLDEASRLDLRSRHYEKYDLASISIMDEVRQLLDISNLFADNLYTPSLFGTTTNVVFEGAQGMLLDQHVGFHPHTTWSDLSPHYAIETCKAAKITDVKVLGLTRAYTTRHGNGPLPTYSDYLTSKYPDACNSHNEWQGAFRVGYLDLPLLKYAVGGLGCKLDGLVVSHLDQIDDKFKVCVGHSSPEKDFGNYHYEDIGPNIEVSEYRNSILRKAVPIYEASNEKDLLAKLEEIAPVVIKGYGPTAEDRTAS